LSLLRLGTPQRHRSNTRPGTVDFTPHSWQSCESLFYLFRTDCLYLSFQKHPPRGFSPHKHQRLPIAGNDVDFDGPVQQRP